jgi:hypothetical protein
VIQISWVYMAFNMRMLNRWWCSLSALEVGSLIAHGATNDNIVAKSMTRSNRILGRLINLSNHLVRFSSAEITSSSRTSRPVYWGSLRIWLLLLWSHTDDSLQKGPSILLSEGWIGCIGCLDDHGIGQVGLAILIFSLGWGIRLSSGVWGKFHI